MGDNNRMAFGFRGDQLERAHSIGIDEARHEEERLVEAAGFNATASMHDTRESAEDAAREMLRRLREVDASIPWAACVAYPLLDGSDEQGRCYPVADDGG